MESATNAQGDKYFCFDCKKQLKAVNKKIINGVLCTYDHLGQKIQISKCRKCFAKNKSLTNFQNCEVYSRVVGYLRPVKQWNEGKQTEYFKRKEYAI